MKNTIFFYLCALCMILVYSCTNGEIYKIISVPDIPTDLTTDVRTVDSITISWRPVEGAAGYDIKIDDNEPVIVKHNIYQSRIKLSIYYLTKDTEYHFAVRAFNNAGSSGYSDTLVVRTLGNVTPTPTPSPDSGITPTPTSSPYLEITPTPTSSPYLEITPTPTSSPDLVMTPTPTPSPDSGITPTPVPTPLYISNQVLSTPTLITGYEIIIGPGAVIDSNDTGVIEMRAEKWIIIEDDVVIESDAVLSIEEN